MRLYDMCKAKYKYFYKCVNGSFYPIMSSLTTFVSRESIEGSQLKFHKNLSTSTPYMLVIHVYLKGS